MSCRSSGPLVKRIRFVPNQNLTGDLYCLQKPRTDEVKPERVIDRL